MEAEAATWALFALSAVLVAVGLAGMMLPVIPGAPVLLAGLVVAAWAEDFVYVGYGTLAVLGLLVLLTYAVDFAAGVFGARRFGATRRGMVGAALGALVGLFFGIPGVLLGPFAGAVLGELSGQRGLDEAGRAGMGASFGLILGAAAKLALAFSMLGLFAAVRLLGAL
ncbi:MAG: DUF456 domain-containing protein [bacterium]|nr:DUF456 domain-containing protein [bacterium]MCP5068050.1 DUF456 domain-containing protein [bacterium]